MASKRIACVACSKITEKTAMISVSAFSDRKGRYFWNPTTDKTSRSFTLNRFRNSPCSRSVTATKLPVTSASAPRESPSRCCSSARQSPSTTSSPGSAGIGSLSAASKNVAIFGDLGWREMSKKPEQFVGFDEAKQQPPVLAKHQPAKPKKHVVAQRFPAFLQQRVQNRGFEKNRGELGGNAELPETQFQNETVLRYRNTAFSSFPKIGRIFA